MSVRASSSSITAVCELLSNLLLLQQKNRMKRSRVRFLDLEKNFMNSKLFNAVRAAVAQRYGVVYLVRSREQVITF